MTAVAAVKTETASAMVDPATITVRAMNMPDLADKATWLVSRLRDRFPQYQDSHIINWLRSIASGSPEHHFVRTNHAVALSEVRKERMTVQPTVIDRFVLIERPDDVPQEVLLAEGQALYDDMKRWAFNLGAQELTVDKDSDVPAQHIAARLGRLAERKTLFVRIGR